MIYETELALGQYDQITTTVCIEFRLFTRKNQWGSIIQMINLLGVQVTSWSSDASDLNRDELEALGGDGSWVEHVDRRAFQRVRELVNAQDWLYDQLCAVEEAP